MLDELDIFCDAVSSDLLAIRSDNSYTDNRAHGFLYGARNRSSEPSPHGAGVMVDQSRRSMANRIE